MLCSKTFLVVVLAFLFGFIGQRIYDAGELHILTSLPVNCEKVLPKDHAFEDFAQFSDGGFATMSSDNSHFQLHPGKSMRTLLEEKIENGKVKAISHLVYVNSKGDMSTIPLEQTPQQFFPHGLAGFGSVEDSDGATMLAVNHKTTGDTLEIMKLTAKSLRFVRSISHPLLFNVNDCVFSSANEVYCTNWRSQETGTFLDAAETYLQMPWTNVVRCTLDNQMCEEVAKDIKMANGIEIAPDGKQVFVVASLARSILIFDRNDATGALKLAKEVPTNASCDNLIWHDGFLLSGCHPKAFTFVIYARNPTMSSSPCEVISLDPTTGMLKTLFMDAIGTEFSACSVAATTAGSLWIGSVHDYGIMKCDLSSVKPVGQEKVRKLMFAEMFQ